MTEVGSGVLERLTSYRQLVNASADDAFVRYGVSPRFVGPGFRLQQALVFVLVRAGRTPGLVGLGPTADLEDLFALLRRDRLLDSVKAEYITVPQQAASVLDRHFEVGPGGDWEWMWTTSPPPVIPAEQQVVDLTVPADADTIAELLGKSSPRSSLSPHQEAAHTWVGIFADGRLVACAAAERTASGAAHLGSIAVHPRHRGRRLGAAITAALTRRFVVTEGVCTLGMYSDNRVARLLYLRLGYRDDHFWASRTMLAVRR